MWHHKYFLLPVITGIIFGYNIGIIAPALPIVKSHLSLTAWQSGHVVSMFIVGLISGALITKPLLYYSTRKNVLILSCFIALIQGVIGLFISNFYSLIFYRFMSGLASGLVATLGPMLCVENSEVELRGKMTSVFQLSIVVGVAFSYLIGLCFLNSQSAEYMFLLGILPALFGLRVFRNYKDLKEPAHYSGYFFQKYKNSYKVALGVNFFQQACGINAITFFIQTLLCEDHLSQNFAYLLPLMLNVVSFASTLFLMKKVDVWGRRRFLMIGALGMSFTMGLLALNHLSMLKGYAIIVFYILFFAISFGPVTYLVTNEVFPDQARSSGASLSFFTNCLTNYFISLIFLPIRHVLGPSSMWALFSVMSACAFLFVWRKVPETAHLKTEDIVKKLN